MVLETAVRVGGGLELGEGVDLIFDWIIARLTGMIVSQSGVGCDDIDKNELLKGRFINDDVRLM